MHSQSLWQGAPFFQGPTFIHQSTYYATSRCKLSLSTEIYILVHFLWQRFFCSQKKPCIFFSLLWSVRLLVIQILPRVFFSFENTPGLKPYCIFFRFIPNVSTFSVLISLQLPMSVLSLFPRLKNIFYTFKKTTFLFKGHFSFRRKEVFRL